jgi:hypothetical protein
MTSELPIEIPLNRFCSKDARRRLHYPLRKTAPDVALNGHFRHLRLWYLRVVRVKIFHSHY